MFYTFLNLKSPMHDLIQSYLDQIYQPYAANIQQSLSHQGNERYGELHYYGLLKVLKYIELSPNDHFLDIGSGLGKVVFQIFLTEDIASVTGIELNVQRSLIAAQVKTIIQQDLPHLWIDKSLNILQGDFLSQDLDHTSVIYVCSTVFSFALLHAMGKKMNAMQNVKKIAAFSKIPHLHDFRLKKTIEVHCSWDKVVCYFYERKPAHAN